MLTVNLPKDVTLKILSIENFLATSGDEFICSKHVRFFFKLTDASPEIARDSMLHTKILSVTQLKACHKVGGFTVLI